METNYVILLDYRDGEIIKIKLSEQEILELEKYDDFEEFLETLEEKYDFVLSDCIWTTMGKMTERNMGF